MSSDLLFRARQNRLLAGIRVIQASFSSLAMLLDPDKPGIRDNVATVMFLTYLGVSVLLLIFARMSHRWVQKIFLPSFVLDFLIFAAVLYLTYGANSPFFLLFTFIVLSATLHWGWRGAASATALALMVFVGIGLALYPQETGQDLDLTRFLIRVGSTAALGALLVAFGRHEERVERDMLRVFGPGLKPAASEQPPIRVCLNHAATVFGVKRGVLVWGDPEEPGLTVSRLDGETFTEEAWPIADDAPPPHLEPMDEPFLFDRDGSAAYVLTAGGQIRPLPDWAPQNPLLLGLVKGEALVLPVRAAGFAGWVILTKLPQAAREALLLGGTVSAQMSVVVESWRSLMAWRDAAAAEEQLSLARNLHDGVLQFMAGTAMQLERVIQDLGPAQQEQVRRIQRLQDDLRAEQQHLRELIGAMGPQGKPRLSAWVELDAELESVAALLRRQWNIDLSFVLDGPGRQYPADFVFELVLLLREAVSNAVRHGRATRVRIDASQTDGEFVVTVADNGCGMALVGEFDMAALDRLAAGPRSLRGRVGQLGGSLAVSSHPNGYTLRIALPQPGVSV